MPLSRPCVGQKMKRYTIVVCTAVFLATLIGCVSAVKNLEFQKLIGSTQTLQREALIYPLSENIAPHFQAGTVGLYDVREGTNSWRTEGRLRPGTPVRILEIKRHLIDARGPWIGAVGLVEDPKTHREVKFLYCWSSGYFLERAPWEDEVTPVRRDYRELR